jgi:hypothetical protein
MKPIEEAFPVQIPETVTKAVSIDEYYARLIVGLDKIDVSLKKEGVIVRPESALELTSKQIATNLANNTPFEVFEKVTRLIEALASGESESSIVEKSLRSSTMMHTEHMVDVYHYTGLGYGGYLNRYLRTSQAKKRKVLGELGRELSSLLSELVQDQQRESEFESAVEDGTVRDRWQEISKFENEKATGTKRGREKRLGRKNTLYTYIKAERSEDTDFDVDQWTTRHTQGRYYLDPREDMDEEEEGNAVDISHNDYDDSNDIEAIDDLALELDIEIGDDSSLPINKVFVGNLPRNVNGSDVAKALRNCGDVAKVWFYNTGKSDLEVVGVDGDIATEGDNLEPVLNEGSGEGDRSNVILEVHQGSENILREGKYAMPDGTSESIANVSIEEVGADVDVDATDVRYASNHHTSSEFEVGELEIDDDEGEDGLEKADDDEDDDDYISTTFGSMLEDTTDETMEKSVFEDDEEEGEEEDLRLAVAKVRRLDNEEAEFKKKTKTLKKRLMRMQRGYNYAYVQMEEDRGYFNATRDEMRVFGVCIQGYNCRIQEASRLRTLIVEVLTPSRCSEIKHTLTANLGSWYNFNYFKGSVDLQSEERAEIDRSKPIFVHLEFDSHQEAWKSFELLDNAYRAGSSNLKVSWVKSEWYWTVAKKARELSYTTSPKKVKSLEQEVEKLAESKDKMYE